MKSQKTKFKNYSLFVFALFIFLYSAQPSVCFAQSKRSVDRPIADKWALVIGVDKYVDKRIPSLKFASKDARDFADFLVKHGNFAKDHVLVLTNQKATSDNIEAAIGDTWFPKRVMKDDLVVIFISCHGSPKEMDTSSAARENWLIAYDTNVDRLFSSGIELSRLAQTVRARTGCDRIVLLLDACNSGAAKAEGGKGLIRMQNFDVSSIVGEGQIVISSSDANQRSWESRRYKNGVFTHNLIKALKANKSTPLNTVFENLKDQVATEVRFDRKVDQTPVYKSKWKGRQLALLAPPARPRKINFPVLLTSDTSTSPESGSYRPSSSRSMQPITSSVSTGGSNNARKAQDMIKQKRYSEAIDILQSAADSGDLYSMNLLGYMYSKGYGVTKSSVEALKWWIKAADQNFAPAQHSIGTLYYHGYGVRPNAAESYKWFKKAAAQNYAKSITYLGYCNEFGYGVPKNMSKAVECYRRASKMKDPLGLTSLGMCHLHAFGIPQNYALARKYLTMAAERKIARSQYWLGRIYFEGWGVTVDNQEAIKWFQAAANQKYGLAQNAMGRAYYLGRGVPKDFTKAAYWYKKAANNKVAAAQNNLGIVYRDGKGVPIDHAKALKYLKMACVSKFPLAFSNLGEAYYLGKIGLKKDYKKAKQLFEQGDKLGSSNSSFYLALMYHFGKGVKKNYPTAVKYYKKAVAKNHGMAQNNLGWCYLKGQGVKRDKATAVSYFRLAANKGIKIAKENLAKYGP